MIQFFSRLLVTHLLCLSMATQSWAAPASAVKVSSFFKGYAEARMAQLQTQWAKNTSMDGLKTDLKKAYTSSASSQIIDSYFKSINMPGTFRADTLEVDGNRIVMQIDGKRYSAVMNPEKMSVQFQDRAYSLQEKDLQTTLNSLKKWSGKGGNTFSSLFLPRAHADFGAGIAVGLLVAWISVVAVQGGLFVLGHSTRWVMDKWSEHKLATAIRDLRSLKNTCEQERNSDLAYKVTQTKVALDKLLNGSSNVMEFGSSGDCGGILSENGFPPEKGIEICDLSSEFVSCANDIKRKAPSSRDATKANATPVQE